MDFTVLRNNKIILQGTYTEQKRFFFRLYFFLLYKCFSNEKVMEIINNNYKLLENCKQSRIYF